MGVQRIFFYCGSLIPVECAATNYYVNLARIHREAGFEVLLLSEVAPPPDCGPDGVFHFRGFPCVALGRPRYRRMPFSFTNYLRFNSPVLDWLQARPHQEEWAGFVACSGMSTITALAQQWARQRGIPCLTVSTEHHLPSHYLKKFNVAAWLDHEAHIRRVNHQADGVAVLSNYSQEFYRSRGVNVMQIRPMIDTRAEMWQPVERGRRENLHLLFMGSPRRDRQDLILEGVRLARERGVPVLLQYAGIGREPFAQLLGHRRSLLDALGQAIRFDPWIPWEQVPELLGSTDFCILFREDLRDMRYGFPSKTVEIMAKGTPVICNQSSDLFTFVQDGVNGFQVGALDAALLAKALERAHALNDATYMNMRRAARATAEAEFDLRHYVPLIQRFYKVAGNGGARKE